MANGGRNPSLQSSPCNDQGGVNIDRQLRQVRVSTGPEYYNPNPLVRTLGRANELEIEINGKISKALIDSSAMISVMSKDILMNMGMRYNCWTDWLL